MFGEAGVVRELLGSLDRLISFWITFETTLLSRGLAVAVAWVGTIEIVPMVELSFASHCGKLLISSVIFSILECLLYKLLYLMNSEILK